jgi:molecular chaperone DnaK
MAAFNKTLGKFQLVGIPPAPRGLPQIEVTFDIDANGILSVSAKDRGTGNEQKIEVRSGSGLSDDEINQMVRDAESHADEDRKLRDLADAKNAAESLIYTTEKSLREHGDRIDSGTRSDIETKVTDLRSTLDGSDADVIRQRSHALTEASYKLAEAVYADAHQHAASSEGETAGTTGQAGGEPDEEIIEDAEIVEDEGATRS